MQQVKQRGATLVKVVSIIMIVFGALSLIGGLTQAGMGSLTGSMLGVDEFAMQYYRITGVLALISGVAYLCIGIFGVRFCNRAGKEGMLLLLGIIIVLVDVFITLYNLTLLDLEAYVLQQLFDSQLEAYGFAATDINVSSFSSANPVMIALSFVLPALFVIGALLNRKPPKPLYPEEAYRDPSKDNPSIR